MKKEPAAPVLSEMMKGFASGRFQTKNEARDFLEGSPDLPKGKIGNSQIDKILKDLLYAEYTEYLSSGVSLRKGKHQGMVDLVAMSLVRLKNASNR